MIFLSAADDRFARLTSKSRQRDNALFPGASKSLTSMCDRLVLDSSERDDRHGALLDADMTADALILLERQLKHGERGAPSITGLRLTG